MSTFKVCWVSLNHTFSRTKIWTKNFWEGRSYIYIHTYKNLQDPKYGDGKELLLMVWNG